jgi:predicted lipoprotein with Yx(FWY)xxD motif
MSRIAALVFGGSVLLAACGSSGYGSGGSPGTNAPTPAAGGSTTLQANTKSDLGTVLADGNGRTVYASDQEVGGKIKCTEGCLQFWAPVTVASGSVAAVTSFPGSMGTVTRPDNGAYQVTYNGRPLYTFTLDPAAGKTTGEGVTDSFGGTSFTWHAVTPKTAANPSKPGSTPTTGSSGGYNY